ncbi:hypothetical protein [Methylobacterium oxalidis]|uniref:hypothetical protein n=1 Tax=Methylobacterium oxalidis TaxID=944322 RepID=UPI003314B38F
MERSRQHWRLAEQWEDEKPRLSGAASEVFRIELRADRSWPMCDATKESSMKLPLMREPMEGMARRSRALSRTIGAEADPEGTTRLRIPDVAEERSSARGSGTAVAALMQGLAGMLAESDMGAARRIRLGPKD